MYCFPHTQAANCDPLMFTRIHIVFHTINTAYAMIYLTVLIKCDLFQLRLWDTFIKLYIVNKCNCIQEYLCEFSPHLLLNFVELMLRITEYKHETIHYNIKKKLKYTVTLREFVKFIENIGKTCKIF